MHATFTPLKKKKKKKLSDFVTIVFFFFEPDELPHRHHLMAKEKRIEISKYILNNRFRLVNLSEQQTNALLVNGNFHDVAIHDILDNLCLIIQNDQNEIVFQNRI